VRECAVVGVTDAAGLTRTRAYLVLAGEVGGEIAEALQQRSGVDRSRGAGGAPGAPADGGPGKIIPDSDLAETLRSFVREHLESHKVPRDLVFLEAMPRTHLGKVDRGRLRGVVAGQ
jgi:acyl-coenzyme A synthetase/AMP-(fatty) acid ligase